MLKKLLNKLFEIKTPPTDTASVPEASPIVNTAPEVPTIPLLFPIGHFYSPIADPIDIKAREEELWARRDHLPGIDLNDAEQLDLLKALKPYVAGISYPVQKPASETTYFYENDQYPALDAQFLYAALCHYKPKRVFEVGSGFSSLITADVNRRILNKAIDFRCLEPYPRQFLIDGVDGITELVQTKIEDMDLSYFDVLEENDILFIDSTHVSKVGSDVNYLFFEVIPRLKKGVIVHIHDIFLPDEYPKNWVIEQGRNWNEQYVLRAFLQFNAKWKIIWAGNYMGTRYLNMVQNVFPDYPNLGGGGSIWIQSI